MASFPVIREGAEEEERVGCSRRDGCRHVLETPFHLFSINLSKKRQYLYLNKLGWDYWWEKYVL